MAEKIFQRQKMKASLSDAVVDEKTDARHQFTREELRDLFAFNPKTLSDTHELLGCECGESADTAVSVGEKATFAQPRASKRVKQPTQSLAGYAHHFSAAPLPVRLFYLSLLLSPVLRHR